MKRIVIVILALLSVSIGNLVAHSAHYDNVNTKQWYIEKQHQVIDATFYFSRNDSAFFEKSDGSVIGLPINILTANDQNFVKAKIVEIEQINKKIEQVKLKNTASQIHTPKFNLIEVGLFVLGGLLLLVLAKTNKRLFVPIASAFVLVSFVGFKSGNIGKRATTTSPTFMDSAFSYYKPTINTRWDNTYFYVESKGIADHEMMIGITSWQQQVPIPQCYIGSNAWSIPLNPVIATTPVPVNNKHFLRGAVAIAVNGIAIFNPYTNTGVDAFLDGQLDNFGGHSGRADDYHYHIAPTVLYNKIPKTSPIAFALDGFAIYGTLEPDGSAMKTLDANHGHYGSNGAYHYHSSSSAPYMIGNMVGKVTEDSTLQIIPQAAAKGVRPALTPLKGAVITHCYPYPTGDGYKLTYTVGSEKDTVDYSWTSAGKFTYKFIVNGVTTVNTYNGSKPCTVPVTSAVNNLSKEIVLNIYPNPATDIVNLSFSNEGQKSLVKKIAVINSLGKVVFATDNFVNKIDLNQFSSGIYYISVDIANQSITQKIIVH